MHQADYWSVTNYVALGKTLCFSGPQFLHPQGVPREYGGGSNLNSLRLLQIPKTYSKCEVQFESKHT